MMYRCAQEHELPQSHRGDNRKGTLFSLLYTHTDTQIHIYIYIYIYILLIISDPRHRCAQVHELPLLLRSNEDLEGPRVLKLLLEQWA